MSTTQPSNPEPEVSLSNVPRRLKPTPNAHHCLRKFMAGQLAMFVALVIVVSGCADLSSPSSNEVFLIRIETVEPTAEMANPSSDESPEPVLQQESVQQSAEASVIVELLRQQHTSTLSDAQQPSASALQGAPPPAIMRAATPTEMPREVPTVASPIEATPTPSPTVAAHPEVEHVVIITIDGLRPDALEMADTPTLDKLRVKGAYSPSARTVDPSITLVSHASMLSGRTKESHGILWNTPYIGWPGMAGPTLFSIAHDAGLSTGMVFGKEKLNYLVLPNSVDKLHGADCHDPEVKDRAIEIIEAGLPNVFFIHFPDTDRVGHDYGWLSANQLYAVTFADRMIGEVVAALEKEDYLASTLLIITSDHGGHLKTHGNDTPEDRTIPWLAVGPTVPPGIILNRQIETYDTAATALVALDLPLPEDVVGQPIVEVLEWTAVALPSAE
jgi:hypothetical protein